MQPSLRIVGGRVLVGAELHETDILIETGLIAAVGGGKTGERAIDARGLLVLPGIVDLHGDAFERQIQPRPGIEFPIDLALADTERQLLANGVTTAFHGITLSWEPGLRGAETWRAILEGLAARRWACDMRVHLRWEAFNLAALDMAIADIAAGRVHLLAFNDHTPSILRALGDPAKAIKFSGRGPLSLPDFIALAERVAARESEVSGALNRIAAAAGAAGIPMASHDDDSVARRETFRAMGARICEFPMAEEVGVAARAAGDAVVMGSPNVVRGRSHLGWASAARLAEAGICTVLSSDYFYPCLARAPFVLAARGVFDLARAWAFVSENPARAGGLSDRGTLSAGKRADIVLVDAEQKSVVATIAGGKLAWLGAEGAARLEPARV
jgi:alpha-D-ribose 1-methylphosphonate 5-triphosphate diphosphatase